MSQLNIRDFIYLDVERIRSFVAQVSEGLPSSRSIQSQHQVGGEAGASGGVAAFFSASGRTDYHYLSSQVETKSLHDHIFEEFYRAMQSRRGIQDMTHPVESSWASDVFNDGMFVEVRGILKVVDYAATLATIKAIPEVEAAVRRLQGGTQSPGPKGRVQSANRIPTQIKDISTVFDQFYRDTIRVKVFPFPRIPSKVFVGSAMRIGFRYSPPSLVNLYGPVIDANWTSILQVHRGTNHEPGSLVSETGNQIEDAVEQMADQMSGLAAITHGIKFPAVPMTPIAIYRQL